VGFTGIALLGRAGEFIRPYLIARRTDLSFSSQLAVWAVERIFDIGSFAFLIVMAIFLPSALPSIPHPEYYTRFREAGFALIALVAATTSRPSSSRGREKRWRNGWNNASRICRRSDKSWAIRCGSSAWD
jgi:hypothetical protein